jgi:hypothetical protein
MRFPLRFRVVAVLVAATMSAATAACSPDDKVPDNPLATALSAVSTMVSGRVSFTDWSLLGGKDSTNVAFAGQLVSSDDQLQEDLGFRSTDAQWELDVVYPRASIVMLHFDTGLVVVQDKLRRLGYHQDGKIFTHSADPSRIWTLTLGAVGVDVDKHLLVGGNEPVLVKDALGTPGDTFAQNFMVKPLLNLATKKLAHIATASVGIGTYACVPLTALVGKTATPAMLATVRNQLKGTFTDPDAEITAMAGATDTTALDAMSFTNEQTAKNNQAGRTAAAQLVNAMQTGGAGMYQATNGTVTGPVLSFDLTAQRPGEFAQRINNGGLGVDVCPDS